MTQKLKAAPSAKHSKAGKSTKSVRTLPPQSSSEWDPRQLARTQGGQRRALHQLTPAIVDVRPIAAIRPAPGLIIASQKRERGLPAMEGSDRKKLRKTGYWKSASPSVAEEVHSGKMSPK
ncbi:hypothetical protein LTR27_001932 [Elasticomyces elasticus]|nr:hypothetical protein LTR27_001932 [Elasticomyces elasticus]